MQDNMYFNYVILVNLLVNELFLKFSNIHIIPDIFDQCHL
jgi:hypothetical protein